MFIIATSLNTMGFCMKIVVETKLQIDYNDAMIRNKEVTVMKMNGAGCPCPRSTSKKAGMRMRVSRLEGAILELTEYVEDYLNVATAAAGSTVGLGNLIARARAMSLITMARSVLVK